MKKIIFAFLFVSILASTTCCFSQSAHQKLKKPVFIVSNDSDKIFDIQMTDDYDSLFNYSMELVQDKMGDIVQITHFINTEGEAMVDTMAWRGAYLEKFVFHGKGKDTDTLYAWRVQLLDKNEVMLNNENSMLKVFGGNYGESISISTPTNEFITEKPVENGFTEFSIPEGLEYINVSIRCDEEKYCIFKYPVR